jgi:hypothetical protein
VTGVRRFPTIQKKRRRLLPPHPGESDSENPDTGTLRWFSDPLRNAKPLQFLPRGETDIVSPGEDSPPGVSGKLDGVVTKTDKGHGKIASHCGLFQRICLRQKLRPMSYGIMADKVI